MERIIYKFCLLISLIMAVSINAFADFADSQAAKVLYLVYEDKPNPPYHYGNKPVSGALPGITLEVLKRLAKELDIEIKVNPMPWARGLALVKHDRADGIFHTRFSRGRSEIGVYPMHKGEVDVSRQLMTQSYVLYKLKDSPLTWDGKSFSHLSGPIGAVIDYSIVDDLKAMGIKVEQVTSQQNNLMKLMLGRIDGVAGVETMNDAIISANPADFKGIIKVFPPIHSKPFYLMLSHKFVKENPVLAEEIWNGIRTIRESGEYDEIAKRYR